MAEPVPAALGASPWQLRTAVRHLATGGLVAYPTEAVYGLGCDPFNPAAVAHLLDLKQRPLSQGLILIAAEFRQLEPLLEPLPADIARRAHTSWPGAATWVWPAHPWVPEWLRGAHTGLAVRVTAHPLAAALCRAWGGPLVSTSANPSGGHPARNPLTVRRMFGAQVGCILHGPLGGRARPTPIRDVLTGRSLRAG